MVDNHKQAQTKVERRIMGFQRISALDVFLCANRNRGGCRRIPNNQHIDVQTNCSISFHTNGGAFQESEVFDISKALTGRSVSRRVPETSNGD